MLQQLIAALLLGTSGLGLGVAAQLSTQQNFRPFQNNRSQIEQRIQNPELREELKDMTQEERRSYMQEHKDEFRQNHQNRPELRENWKDMTDEEKQTWKKDHKPKRADRPELPENWSEMTQVEKKAWAEENGIERLHRKRGQLQDRFQNLTDEQREELKAKMEAKRAEFENMTEEERAEFKESHPRVRNFGQFKKNHNPSNKNNSTRPLPFEQS